MQDHFSRDVQMYVPCLEPVRVRPNYSSFQPDVGCMADSN